MHALQIYFTWEWTKQYYLQSHAVFLAYKMFKMRMFIGPTCMGPHRAMTAWEWLKDCTVPYWHRKETFESIPNSQTLPQRFNLFLRLIETDEKLTVVHIQCIRLVHRQRLIQLWYIWIGITRLMYVIRNVEACNRERYLFPVLGRFYRSHKPTS